ncbi:MFS transporter [Tersicoccus phoenicis]|uniref:MFS transporter n=1 Tax=Tersicoccus phoenicis TaxID=554083 RepID=A0A1R1LJD0_9MICC|nr:MFS transporter [Tersicoccus phoenicis]OMH27634.1 MFS transporter [Tersicoccus phoenicis]
MSSSTSSTPHRSPSGAGESGTPAALAEPVEGVRPRWVLAVTLATLGVNAVLFACIKIYLALQAERFDAGDKEAVLALVTGVGAAVSLVANPVFGMLSDRTVSRFGRRVPWVVIGAAISVVGLLVLAISPGIGVMVLGWSLVQAGANAMTAALTAAVPDRVPRRQRGRVGGWIALGTTTGILAGMVIANVARELLPGYLLCAAVLLALAVPYLRSARDVPLQRHERPVLRARDLLAGFWISPRRYPDFGWAWLTRFLVFLGNSLFTLYLLYFLQDAVGYPDPTFGVLVLTGCYAAAVLVTAVIAGPVSDRVGRRKPFVIGSSLVIAVASLVAAFSPTFPGALIAAVVLGIGFGAYLAVDFALLTEVLPAAADRGKDMGVINIAASLPQVLAPVIAWPLVTSGGGFVALFGCAALAGLLGGIFIVPIRSVR